MVNFKDELNSADKLFVPLQGSRTRNRPKWMNKKSRAAQNYKSRMWKRQQKTRDYNDTVEYKRAQKQ